MCPSVPKPRGQAFFDKRAETGGACRDSRERGYYKARHWDHQDHGSEGGVMGGGGLSGWDAGL